MSCHVKPFYFGKGQQQKIVGNNGDKRSRDSRSKNIDCEILIFVMLNDISNRRHIKIKEKKKR